MTGTWRLDTLPTDVLILIFNYCHAFDLVRLSEVCTRFNEIIRSETLWIRKSKQPLATNQASERFRERCDTLLCLRTRWHVSHNWQYGKYKKSILFSRKTKLMPWLQLSDKILWWSGGSELCCYNRRKPPNENTRFFNTGIDICKFVVRDGYIITGHICGALSVWASYSNGDFFYFCIKKAHNTDINAVDRLSELIFSGSGDGTVKTWNVNPESVMNVPSGTLNVSDRIWSLAVDPIGTKFAVGSSGNSNVPPLHIFDVECFSDYINVKHNWRKGAGILDMVWDDPNTLLTCGYDTYIRKWDMRTGTCVSSWADPTDATLYCISSDYQNTMVTGTQFNCKAVLWDQRQRNYIQLYFLNLRRLSSPVYCLAFDSSHLYGATDQQLVELTFSGYSYKKTNYKEILRY